MISYNTPCQKKSVSNVTLPMKRARRDLRFCARIVVLEVSTWAEENLVKLQFKKRHNAKKPFKNLCFKLYNSYSESCSTNS